LPRTINDAISVTEALSIYYLWIDALCIQQDAGEDKDTVIANMHNIYENSFITIAAASA
ncbi:heterokaryon incompatibility, partial [Paraphaeosphaeria sporulosa]